MNLPGNGWIFRVGDVQGVVTTAATAHTGVQINHIGAIHFVVVVEILVVVRQLAIHAIGFVREIRAWVFVQSRVGQQRLWNVREHFARVIQLNAEGMQIPTVGTHEQHPVTRAVVHDQWLAVQRVFHLRTGDKHVVTVVVGIRGDPPNPVDQTFVLFIRRTRDTQQVFGQACVGQGA